MVQPSLTRQLVSGKGGVGDSAADSPKYILILEVRYGVGVFWMIAGPVSWYWESERGGCWEDAPDSFKSTAHPGCVWRPAACEAKFARLE